MESKLFRNPPPPPCPLSLLSSREINQSVWRSRVRTGIPIPIGTSVHGTNTAFVFQRRLHAGWLHATRPSQLEGRGGDPRQSRQSPEGEFFKHSRLGRLMLKKISFSRAKSKYHKPTCCAAHRKAERPTYFLGATSRLVLPPTYFEISCSARSATRLARPVDTRLLCFHHDRYAQEIGIICGLCDFGFGVTIPSSCVLILPRRRPCIICIPCVYPAFVQLLPALLKLSLFLCWQKIVK